MNTSSFWITNFLQIIVLSGIIYKHFDRYIEFENVSLFKYYARLTAGCFFFIVRFIFFIIIIILYRMRNED